MWPWASHVFWQCPIERRTAEYVTGGGQRPLTESGNGCAIAFVSPAGDPKAPHHSRGCTSDSHCKASFLYAHQQKNHGCANTKVRGDNTSETRDSDLCGLFCFLLMCTHPKITKRFGFDCHFAREPLEPWHFHSGSRHRGEDEMQVWSPQAAA